MKSQSTIEFMIIIGILSFFILTLSALLGSKFLSVQEEKDTKIMENFALSIENEIDIASSSLDGYERNFNIPQTIDENQYTIKILGNRELTIFYKGKEHTVFLPDQIVGNISKGTNRIVKKNGVVYISNSTVYG
jgi:hypothetical protein